MLGSTRLYNGVERAITHTKIIKQTQKMRVFFEGSVMIFFFFRASAVVG